MPVEEAIISAATTLIQALLIPRRRPVRMAGMEEGTTILQMVFMVGIR